MGSKALIEQSPLNPAEAMGIAVWCEDEAGPFGRSSLMLSWRAGNIQQHILMNREGTAKLLNLSYPKGWQGSSLGYKAAQNRIASVVETRTSRNFVSLTSLSSTHGHR